MTFKHFRFNQDILYRNYLPYKRIIPVQNKQCNTFILVPSQERKKFVFKNEFQCKSLSRESSTYGFQIFHNERFYKFQYQELTPKPLSLS